MMAKIELTHSEKTFGSRLRSPLRKAGISFCTSRKQSRITPPTIGASLSMG